jgi:hypothetical protein
LTIRRHVDRNSAGVYSGTVLLSWNPRVTD